MSKYVAVTSLIAYAAVSAYRCFLLVTGKNVYWFSAVAGTGSDADLGLSLLPVPAAVRSASERIHAFGRRDSPSEQILHPLRHHGLFFSLTDRVMITLLLGREANGFYSAAVTCAT